MDGTASRLTDFATFSVRDVCSGAFHPAVAYSIAPASTDEKHAVISGCGSRTCIPLGKNLRKASLKGDLVMLLGEKV